MALNFFLGNCQNTSNRKIFGLCDDPPPVRNPAYIDETDGGKWIAVVENEERREVTFTAIDNCIAVTRPDGKMAQRCDGMLTFGDTLILVELKERSARGNDWVEDAEEQLIETIKYLETTEKADDFSIKRAYIANNKHPKFKSSQNGRMENFKIKTGYVLRIINRIAVP